MKFLFLAFALTLPIHAQAPGVPIFEQSRTGLRTEDLTISKQVEKLLGEGKLMSLEKIENSLKFPTPVPLNLPPTKSQNLTPTKIAKLAKESGYRIGWAYLCQNCDNWHVNLAGGYALTSDGVLGTCAHVIMEKKFAKVALSQSITAAKSSLSLRLLPTMKKSMVPSSRLTQKPNPLLSMTRSTPAMPLSA